MATKRIAFNRDTKIVTVLEETGDVPSGSEVIGTFVHEDQLDPLGPVLNHVLFHHVRDLLYPLGEWNFQTVKIQYGEDVEPLDIAALRQSGEAEINLVVGDTYQLDEEGATYKTADEGVVTVAEDGLVEAVGEGTTTITVTKDEEEVNLTVWVSAEQAVSPEENAEG